MAIGGYSWDEDWAMTSGMDMGRMEKYFTVRMRFEGEVLRELQSAEPAVYVPPDVLEQKLALLKVAPVGAKVDGVGWRRAENLFYLRIYEDDLPLGGMK